MKDIVGKKAAERDGCGAAGRQAPQHSGQTRPRRNADTVRLALPPGPGRYPHTIGLRIDYRLYSTAENALEGAHRAGDYTFTSLPDLVRAALRSYFGGMALDPPSPRGGKRRTTIGLDDNLKTQYDELPQRKRGEIIERALNSFLNRGMTAGRGW